MSRYDNDNDTRGRGDIGNRSSREIKHDIDRTLSEMDQTVNQLQGRLSLRSIVHELTGSSTETPGRTGEIARQASGRVWDAARANPGPAALLGLGMAWLVVDRLGKKGRHEHYEVGRGRDRDWLSPGAEYFPADSFNEEHGRASRADQSHGFRAELTDKAEDVRERTGRAMGSVRDKASHAVDAVKERASEIGESLSGLRESTGQRVSHLRESASDLSAQARQRVHDLGHQVQVRSSQLKSQAEDLYDETPLAFGAAALALGVGLGLLIPSTRKEDEFLGRRSDRLKDKAKELGQTALEQGEQVTQQVVGKVKEQFSSGDNRPLVEKAKEVVNRVIDTTKDQVKQSVQSMNTKDTTGNPNSANGGKSVGKQRPSPGADVGDDVNVD